MTDDQKMAVYYHCAATQGRTGAKPPFVKFTHPTPHNCVHGFLKRYNRAARLRGMKTIWEKISVAPPSTLKAGRI